MPDSIITWLKTASWLQLSSVFLIENMLIFALVIICGNWLAKRYAARRVALEPEALTRIEVIVALVNVILNTATTIMGLWLWRKGIIRFRTDIGLWAIADILILLIAMDLLMYLLHRVAHTRLLFPILHQFHHQYDRPRPINLFALNPFENLAFGGLWLAVITVYPASWAGMSTYLILNVAFGAVGHLGVEPLPASWGQKRFIRNMAGGSFHAQHHQDRDHNFGFYTLIWDRLFGTLRTDYESNVGKIPEWLEEPDAELKLAE